MSVHPLIASKKYDTDSVMLFIMNVWREPVAWVQRALSSYQSWYPDAQFLVVGDGPWRSDLSDFLAEIPYIARGTRMKQPATGHQYTTYWFDRAARYDSDYVFKIDPDTEMHRPFRPLPEAQYFGTQLIVRDPEKPSVRRPLIWGCCAGFSGAFLRRCLAEHLLDRPDLAVRSIYKQDQFCEDLFLSRVCEANSVPLVDWVEVCGCSGRDARPWERRKYAVSTCVDI